MADKEKVIRVVVDPSGVKKGVTDIKRQFDSLRSSVGSQFQDLANKLLFTMGGAISVLSKRIKDLASSIPALGSLFSKTFGAASRAVSAFASTVSRAASFIGGSFGVIKKAIGLVGSAFTGVIGIGVRAATLIGSAWKGLGGIFSSVFKSLGGIKSIFQTAVTGVLTREIVKATVTMQKFAGTLTVVTGDFKSAKAQIGNLIGIVQKFGVSLEAALGPFAKFYAAAKSTLTENEILKVFTAFTEVSTALQLNVQEVQGVFLALQQIASKGRVSMEELRLQLAERVPGAMQIAAESMGMSIRELEDAIRKGSLSSGEFLRNFGDALHEHFGKAAETASQLAFASINRLRNAFMVFASEVGEGGFITAVQRMMTVMTNWLENNHALARRLGELLGMLVDKVTDFVEKLTAEKLTAYMNTALDYLYKIFEIGERIANSRFFKWLFGGSELSQLEGQISQSQAKLNELGIAYARVFSDENWIKNDEVRKQQGQRLLGLIEKENERLQKLQGEYDKATGGRTRLAPGLLTSDAGDFGPTRQDFESNQRQLEFLGKTYTNVGKEVEYYLTKLNSIETKESELTQVTNELTAQQKLLNQAVAEYKAVDKGSPESLSKAISAGQKVSGLTDSITKLKKKQLALEKSITAEQLRRSKFQVDFAREFARTEDQLEDRLTRQLALEDDILETRIKLDELNESIQAGTFTKEQENQAKSLLTHLKQSRSELESLKREEQDYHEFMRDFNIDANKLRGEELNWYERMIKTTGELKKVKSELLRLNDIAQTRELSKPEQQQVEDLTKQYKALQQEMDRSTVFAKRAAENIQDIFADFLFDPFKEGVDGMLQQFGDMLRRMIAEAAAAQIGEMIFGKNGANLVTLFQTVSGAASGSASTPAATPAPTRASGGPVIAGVPFIGGDRNTAQKGEYFVPNQSGKVLSRSDEENMKNSPTGGSIIVNVSVAKEVSRSSGVQVGNDIARQLARARRMT